MPSGERTHSACWRRRPADANFSVRRVSSRFRRSPWKFVAAECRDQHAASMRSPETQQIALAQLPQRTHTRRRNEPARQRRQSSCLPSDDRRRLPWRGAFRSRPFRDPATPRADSRHDRLAEPRMRGDPTHIRQLPAHSDRHDLARPARATSDIRPRIPKFSISQRASRIFSARARAAGSFLTIGAPRLSGGSGLVARSAGR